MIGLIFGGTGRFYLRALAQTILVWPIQKNKPSDMFYQITSLLNQAFPLKAKIKIVKFSDLTYTAYV